MKIPIIFSTITGNAFKVAEAVKGAVSEPLGPYNITYINDEVIAMFDTFILVYWCNHGTCDDDTIRLIRKMKQKKIIILGTLGVSLDSEHAKKVKQNVAELVQEENILLGNFLCRGAIDLNRTARKLKIPEGEKGHLSQARFEKQKESLGHPDQQELQAAYEFVKTTIHNE